MHRSVRLRQLVMQAGDGQALVVELQNADRGLGTGGFDVGRRVEEDA